MEIKSRTQLVLVVSLIITIILAILLSAYFFIHKKENLNIFSKDKDSYLIQNVPYVGYFNHTGERNYLKGNGMMALASIFEYWIPNQNNFLTLSESFDKNSTFLINSSLTHSSRNRILEPILNRVDFSYESVTLGTEDLKKYINKDIRTPLLISLPVDKNQPEKADYFPTYVVIGIDYENKKITTHSPWLGNNYEIPFSDFETMQERRGDQKNTYIVIRPNNFEFLLQGNDNEKKENYPQRTEIMNQAEEMFKDYALAYILDFSRKENDLAITYYQKVIGNPKFEEFFPPYFKVSTFSFLANKYLDKNNFEDALKFANLAVEANKDLNQPFKDWPGYEIKYSDNSTEIGRCSEPYVSLGNVYQRKGEFTKAIEAFEEALKINPDDISIQGLLKSTKEISKMIKK